MKRRVCHIIIFWVCILSSTLTYSQAKNTSENRSQEEGYRKARMYYNRAVTASTEDRLDSIAINIQKSLEISLNNSYSDLTADNYKLLGLAYDKIPDWENTLRNLLRAGSGYSLAGMKDSEAAVWGLVAGRYFSFEVYRKTVDYARRSFSLYSSEKKTDKATSAEMAGEAFFMLNDFTNAVRWFDTAMTWFEKQADTAGMVRALEGSASSYIRVLDASVSLSKVWMNNINLSSTLTSRILGSVSSSLAISHYEKLLPIHERQNDTGSIAGTYNNLGYIYFRQEAYTRAMEYFLKAVEYMEKSGAGKEEMASMLANLAICQLNTGNEDTGFRTFEKSLSYAGKGKSVFEKARIEHIISRIYLGNNDLYHAEIYCRDCIESSGRSENYNVLRQCYQTLSEIKEKGNDFVKALEYFQKYLSLRDSLTVADELSNSEKEQRLQYYEALEQKLLLDISDEDMRFLTIRKLRADSLSMQSELRALRSDSLSKQSEIMALHATADLKASEQQRLEQALDLEVERNRSAQQERDIQALEQEKTIADLTLKAQADEQEKLLQQVEMEKARRKTAIVLVILAIIIALTILASLISSRSKNRKLAESKRQIEEINLDLEKKNREVSDQKEVIEEKNKSITDSIQYASRIQSAVLPPVTFMNEWGIESFILFMPKDIVSGDFYWGTRKRGKMVMAAADCTGHGVPGAFMSMLGNAFLNEIVNIEEELEPAKILNVLRDDVIRALKQKGVFGEARDGMDISLCVIDPVTLSGKFAGANNPLYIVRDGQLNKIAADRMPIGIHVIGEKPFGEQQLTLKKGDTLYLFTDGYADQFGGPQGKKFMYKPFQDLLVSIAHEPVEKQKEILQRSFTEWQGSYEQVDDVLVMGFRL